MSGSPVILRRRALVGKLAIRSQRSEVRTRNLRSAVIWTALHSVHSPRMPAFCLLLEAMAKHGAIGLYTEDLGEKVYSGKTVILTDERTGSAAEGFVAYMKEKTKSTIVGRATAGQLLTSNPFPLPNGWQLILPIAVPISSERKLFKDTPITPHVEVILGLARRSGQAAAIRLDRAG